MVHQQLCVEFRNSSGSCNGPECLTKIVTPLRKGIAILFGFSKIARLNITGKDPLSRLQRIHLPTEAYCPNETQDHFSGEWDVESSLPVALRLFDVQSSAAKVDVTWLYLL